MGSDAVIGTCSVRQLSPSATFSTRHNHPPETVVTIVTIVSKLVPKETNERDTKTKLDGKEDKDKDQEENAAHNIIVDQNDGRRESYN